MTKRRNRNNNKTVINNDGTIKVGRGIVFHSVLPEI